MNASIIILKMVNGDEILGQYKSDDQYSIYVTEPLQIQSVYDMDQTSNKIVLVPYAPFTEDSTIIAFNKAHVTYTNEVKSKIIAYYNNSLEYIKKTYNKNELYNNDLEDSKENDISNTNTYIYKNTSKAIH